MLPAPDVGLVLCRHLVELESAVHRMAGALRTQALHLQRRHRLEAPRHTEVLPKHAHGIDAAHGGRHGEAHRVAQRVPCRDDSLFYRFSLAAETLHPDGPDAAARKLGEHLLFEAPERRIETVERQLKTI